MYATLYDFVRMSREEQAKVTHLDLRIADWEGCRMFQNDEAEEYPGERQEVYPEKKP